MNINIIYGPDTFTYSEFFEIEKECFPHEPFSLDNFNEMKMGCLRTALIDDKIVGYAYVKINNNSAHLSRIGVKKHYRMMGIANQLMETIITYCAEQSRHSIDLLVETKNHSAIKLYEKFGFKYIESSYQYIIPISDVISKYKRSDSYKLNAISITDNNTPSEDSYKKEQHDEKKQNSFPRRYQLNFIDNNGTVYGNCRLDPKFPGCSPFTIYNPDRYFIEALLSLEKYLNPTKKMLIITFSDSKLKRTCSNLGFKLNYELIRMKR